MPRLVEDWKDAWRWLSINCMAVATALQGAWMYVPDDLRESVPKNAVQALTVAILVLGIVGRIIKQPDHKCEGKDANPDS